MIRTPPPVQLQEVKQKKNTKPTVSNSKNNVFLPISKSHSFISRTERCFCTTLFKRFEAESTVSNQYRIDFFTVCLATTNTSAVKGKARRNLQLFPVKNTISLKIKYKMSDLQAASGVNLQLSFPLVQKD